MSSKSAPAISRRESLFTLIPFYAVELHKFSENQVKASWWRGRKSDQIN